jgi:hypothetical protein
VKKGLIHAAKRKLARMTERARIISLKLTGFAQIRREKGGNDDQYNNRENHLNVSLS